MKILFLSDVPLRQPSSGSEQVLYQQAHGLAKRGHEISAITRECGRGPVAYNNADGISESVYLADPRKPLHFMRSALTYPKEILQHTGMHTEHDAVVSHQPFTQVALSLRKAMPAKPVIYVYHSPSHEEYRLKTVNALTLPNILLTHMRRWIEGYCVNKAGRIVVLSQYMASKLKQIHKIDHSKISINPGGVDHNVFTPLPGRDRIKADLKYPPDRIHLLTIRNLEPRMGVENLIAAVKLLLDGGMNLHLTIGGHGPERNTLEAQVRRMDLVTSVRFVGYISVDKMVAYYNGADFFVLPTKKLEGFGLVTPESMACGTPVLGTPVGGTQEILSAFNRSFLSADRSPAAIAKGIKLVIDQYYYDKSAYRALRFKCREYTQENYSWDRHVKALETILTGVISNAI